MLQSVEYCAAGWFVQGYAGSGDNLRDGLMEAVDRAAMGYLGGLSYAPGVGGVIEKGLLEGSVGGLVTKETGGSFVGGFLGAFTGAVMESQLTYGSFGQDVLDVAIASAVGGGISKLAGASFANGAWSAAFQQMFNAIGNATSLFAKRLAKADAKIMGKQPTRSEVRRLENQISRAASKARKLYRGAKGKRNLLKLKGINKSNVDLYQMQFEHMLRILMLQVFSARVTGVIVGGFNQSLEDVITAPLPEHVSWFLQILQIFGNFPASEPLLEPTGGVTCSYQLEGCEAVLLPPQN